ncbi:MAG TPA: DUF1223 domain-containing protein [Caulobacteraceae bacterium]|nr:DUF1223 domain-containing protein [Caulobacteraceae bacterium]
MIGYLALLLAAVAAAVSVHAADKPPVVIELYQSQGCSSCPPADLNVNAIADRPDVIALSFAVTYWDQLGWKDTFAKPAFTQRQWDYAHAFKRGEVATPQVVINGRSDVVGNIRPQIEAAIARAQPFSGPTISVAGNKVTLGAGATADADVWLVRYDPRVHQVPIARGENAGKTLPHKNIVRELVRLGGWTGRAVSFDLPTCSEPGLKSAILVQARKGGPILSAARA